MVLKVSVRSGGKGKVTEGQAWVGTDAPDGMPALVVAGGRLWMPGPGLIVRFYRDALDFSVLDLLKAGYAVQRAPDYMLVEE